MIKLTEFLLILENLTNYNKKDVDQGKIPSDVYIICSCIRNVFCLSYSIRKDNIFYLFITKRNLIIKLDGKRLKYLGPDERSQSLLLNKALNLSNQTYNMKNQLDWIKSTPGIFIQNFPSEKSLVDILISITNKNFAIFNGNNILFTDFIKISPKNLKQLERSFLIFPSYLNNHNNFEIFYQLNEKKTILNFKIPYIKSIEDKILYINFQIDRLKEKNLLD